MNKVIIAGRLTRTPEVRYSQSAEPVAVVRFSVAVNRKKFKKDGEQQTDFINCIAFGKTGEFVSKYFDKGKMIGLVGSIRTNSWTDNDGNKKYSTDIAVDEVEFLEKKQDENTNNNLNENSNDSNEFYTTEENVEDENLPF